MSLTRPTCDWFFFLNLIALMCSHVTLLPGLAVSSSQPFLLGLRSACCPPSKEAAPVHHPRAGLSFVTLVSWCVTVPLSRQGCLCSLVQTWAKAKFLSNPRTFDFFLWISVGAEEHLKRWPIVLQSVIHFAVMTSLTIP